MNHLPYYCYEPQFANVSDQDFEVSLAFSLVYYGCHFEAF